MNVPEIAGVGLERPTGLGVQFCPFPESILETACPPGSGSGAGSLDPGAPEILGVSFGTFGRGPGAIHPTTAGEAAMRITTKQRRLLIGIAGRERQKAAVRRKDGGVTIEAANTARPLRRGHLPLRALTFPDDGAVPETPGRPRRHRNPGFGRDLGVSRTRSSGSVQERHLDIEEHLVSRRRAAVTTGTPECCQALSPAAPARPAGRCHAW